VLEEGEIERVGGEKPFAVDVRVVVATHRNLEEQVRQGTFREDLYHRIFVFPITLPPLRERREDIKVLAEHFVRQLDERNSWKPKRFSPAAIEELEKYPWPGNVRELRNVVERVLLMAPGEMVEPETVARALPQALTTTVAHDGALSAAAATGPLATRVEVFERETLLAVLKQHHNHMTNTAKALGLERSHLYKKCQQLGIDLRSLRQTD
jgi:two-component system, NtrC family, nitrogen regulation response regulator NtrX